MRDVASLTHKLIRHAIHVVKRDAPTRSHFGGRTELPAGVKWPEWNRKPLGFLARISLAEVQRAHRISWLPISGALLFFYDVEKQPWGFDPEHRGGAAVIHVPDLEGPAEWRDGPVGFSPISFRKIDLLPSSENEAVRALELTEEEEEAYTKLRYAAFGRAPVHQIGGYPTPVQGDEMEVVCQLASNGFSTQEMESPGGRMLAEGARDWRLLFQVDSDRQLGMMWGDLGTIYFWVRQGEAASGRFENAWLVLQCC